MGHLGKSSVITRVPIREQKRLESVADVKKRKVGVTQGRNQKSKCAIRWLPEARKGKETEAPADPPKGASPVDTLTLAQWKGLGLLDFRTITE